MADEILLNEAQYKVWSTLVNSTTPISVNELVRSTGLDQSQVTATGTEAVQRGFFAVHETEFEELAATEDAHQYLNTKLPERRAAEHIIESGGQMPMQQFVQWAQQSGVAVNDVFKWGVARNWIKRENTDVGLTVCTTPTAKTAIGVPQDDERALHDLVVYGPNSITFFELKNYDSGTLRQFLGKRPEIAKSKKRVERSFVITTAGKEAFIAARRILERNSLTPEDLESGAWKEIKLRPYDVKLAAKDVYPAKIHPLRKIIEQTRRAFLEMGFAEVVSPMVESAFWNFDALFQPQDHPARDMQDTFYMLHPAEAPLPDAKIMEPVKQTHENGWTTGSEGWGYKWSPERSKQVVLRTHTTAATIRALAANPNPPGKFFCVGWTYRNETISFKHLPVFHQVDGIIIDEEANLASLMGTLQEFYSKMGFGRVKFKPAFYPYTEPSVDVVVFMESRGKWIEMGGAGIFRPEVTLPLGCNYPVLAWGLGIERLAMLRFGLSDIRELYKSNLDALEEVPLCR
jgi:phenylalanyl-tRNA synthetase alpha chain